MATIIRSGVQALDARAVAFSQNMESWGLRLPTRIKFATMRPGTSFGRCRKDSESYAVIRVSEAVIAEGGTALDRTVYHELCHAAAPKGAHHGPQWKAVASVVTEHTGIAITRLSSSQGMSSRFRDMYKYHMRCSKCGATIERNRWSSWMGDIGKVSPNGKPKVYCTRCGGAIEFCNEKKEKGGDR